MNLPPPRRKQPSAPTGYSRVDEDTRLVTAPPRQSQPGGDLFSVVLGLQATIGELEAKVDHAIDGARRLETQVATMAVKMADVESQLANMKAAGRSETTKLIVGGLVTVALAFVTGKVSTANQSDAPKVEVHESSLSAKLKPCEDIQDGVERARCITVIAAEAPRVAPR